MKTLITFKMSLICYTLAHVCTHLHNTFLNVLRPSVMLTYVYFTMTVKHAWQVFPSHLGTVCTCILHMYITLHIQRFYLHWNLHIMHTNLVTIHTNNT